MNFLHVQHYADPSVSQLQLMTIGLHETEKYPKVNWFNCPNIKLLVDTLYAHWFPGLFSFALIKNLTKNSNITALEPVLSHRYKNNISDEKFIKYHG